MTTKQYRYFKVCPRGFTNEVTYFRVPLAQVAEVNEYFATYEDENPSGSAQWTSDKRAHQPGVAIDWRDRAKEGICD